MQFLDSQMFKDYAQLLARLFMGGVFLFGAFGKIPGTESFGMMVASTDAAGVPLASIAVTLAFILELVAGAALIVGWKVRLTAFVLTLYVALLTLIFHMSFADPMSIGFFMSHLYLMAGLLYMAGFGTNYMAIDAK